MNDKGESKAPPVVCLVFPTIESNFQSQDEICGQSRWKMRNGKMLRVARLTSLLSNAVVEQSMSMSMCTSSPNISTYSRIN